MTKKIVWRLKETPTSENLRELVKDGILSKEEAREILFSLIYDEEVSRGGDILSLKDEIKFLRELVEKLSISRWSIVTTIREIEAPYRKWDWYRPYVTWCNVSNSTISTGTTSRYGSNGPATILFSNFSDIKTF